MQDLHFYQSHLNSVSRSFAFCIERLNSPLRQWVSLMYLLCRVIDTAEDIPWSNLELRSVFFKSFRDAFKSQTHVLMNIEDELFKNTMTPAEAKLLEDLPKLVEDFHGLDPRLQVIIKDLIFSMSEGMEFFLKKYSEQKSLKIQNFQELNQYCFYVAGVVGEALTRILDFMDSKESSQRDLQRAYHFGLFLQKINILKDQLKDEEQGRFFVYDRERVRSSLKNHAYESFKYILNITEKHKDYKVFCSWSFFLGLESLPFIDQSYKAKKQIKITRMKALSVISKVEKIIYSPEQLNDYFNKLTESIFSIEKRELQKNSMSSDEDSLWFNNYQGLIHKDNLQEIIYC